ncbi:aspartate/glutamate racemase family protein [Streptomyces sp. WM6378]|uniref:aspartate/glutamate racemase family protein n=1 Tax=Streptomyces sp. WM6378 TaxID=1415557 RepID=UPI0006AD9EB0|nr:aspartate/glutamate racemase family protein [Streptomyces sp. WM6378]KOU34093.1 arylsulfatase [Streptomyces sp. WM6378]
MLALLHTSPAHVPVFDALRDEDAPDLELRHLVHEQLLSRARELGPDAVTADVEAALAEAVAQGAGAVLCTCSTIGGIAEAAAAPLGIPVLRVDRPMAAAAVAQGDRIAVVATVASTLEPTADLIREEAGDRPLTLRTVLAEDAWQHFESGDADAYFAQIAATVDALTDVDVVVLAQASMAPAAARTTIEVPVLSSPRPGLRAAAAVAG